MKKLLTMLIGLLMVCSIGNTAVRPAIINSVTTVATVTTISAVVAAANNSRKDLILINVSDHIIWINRGADAVATASIPLAASTGTYTMDADNLYLGDIEALSNITAKKLVIIEGY